MNNLKNLYLGLIVLSTLLLSLSCEKETTIIKTERKTGLNMTLDPGVIQATISSPFIVEVDEEFELYLSGTEEGIYYNWTVPEELTLLSGQGTGRIRVVCREEGVIIAQGSISVRAQHNGVISAAQRFGESIATPVPLDVPVFLVTGYSTDPPSGDAPYEYIQLRATQNINFEQTPFTVVTCNNATASVPGDWFLEADDPTNQTFLRFQGWATGGIRTYKFELTTGSVNKGDFFYIGGNAKLINGGSSASMADAKWIESASVPYHQIESPEFYPGGPKGSPTTNLMANSGYAFGIAAFRGLEVRETSIPMDLVWTTSHTITQIYNATKPVPGWRIGNTDWYSVMNPNTEALQPFFIPTAIGPNNHRFIYSLATNSGWFLMMGGVFDPSTNTWIEPRRMVIPSGAGNTTAQADEARKLMPFVTPSTGSTYHFLETPQEVTGSDPMWTATPTQIL